MASRSELAMILRARDEGVKAMFDSTKGAADAWGKSLNQTANEVSSSFANAFRGGLGIGAGIAALQAGLGAIGGTFGAIKSSVIDFNQQLDQSRAVFTRYFEGNAQVAEQFLNTLKGFAATTPFEFKDLSSLAVRLQNANVSANDIIPTIKAIGNAASASGSLSKESLDRITLALTQIQMKGKVTGEEMLQLVENGVPAWQLLADATGKPIPVLQELASKGQISADVLMKAFRDAYENAGLMEGASRSLEGALSTIRDVGTQALADVGRGIYDLATQGANALATFLSSADFQTWINAAKVGVDSLVEGIRGLVSALEPVGATIAAAFRQLTAGDFSGAFATLGTAMRGALDSAMEAVSAVARQMFGAGATLIGELAGGIIAGANQTLMAALDVVASTIAAFLIGQSPPPEGPLSRIREGGANTIAAWADGAAAAADHAVLPVAQKIAGDIGQLKLAGRDADTAIREIARSIQDVESASRDLRFAAEDIKRSYDDQIGALDGQIKALTSARDVQRDRARLELDLEDIQLRQAELAAMGDRDLRAQLQSRLEQLKAINAERKSQEALADAARDVAGSEKERLRAQLDAQKLAQQERDLRSRLREAKGPERERIQSQLKELEIRKQIDAAEARERQEAAERRAADARAKAEELEIQAQLDALVDKGAIAAIKARRDALALRKDDVDLAEQAERLQREMAAGPLKEQRDALAAERDALLKPLQDQLEALNRQKAALSEQRQEMQNYKAEVAAVAQGLKDQEGAIKAAAAATKEAAAARASAGPDKSFTPDAAAEAAITQARDAGARLATGLRDGFIDWISANPLVTGAGLAGALFGAGQGAALGASLGSVVPVIGTAIGGVLGAGLGAAIGSIGVSQLAGLLQAKIEELIGGPLIEAIRQKLQALQEAFASEGFGGLVSAVLRMLAEAAPRLAEQMSRWAGAFVGWAEEAVPWVLGALGDLLASVIQWIARSAGPIGDRLAAWALALVGWARTAGIDLLSRLADLVGTVLSWLGQQARVLAGTMLEWATVLVAWVRPKIPEVLGELGQLAARAIEWIAENAGRLADGLAAWALEFVRWIGPKIPDLLRELGSFLVAILSWMVNDGLPNLVEKLAEWGLAFIAWVAPRIPPLLLELGSLLLELTGWIITTALPAIVEKLGEWALAFVKWVPGAIVSLLYELGRLEAEFLGWIGGKVADVARAALDLGIGLVGGIRDGIGDALSGFWNWLQDNFIDRIPGFVRELLGIRSPSGVFADIGRNIVEGLRVGMESRLPSIDELIERMVGTIADAGEVADWLQAAMRIAGVGGDWMRGLLRLVDLESSGNPRARNPQSVNGEHASGLLQTLPSTFRAYRDRDLPNDIFNPIANAVAAIKYIIDQYGHVNEIPGLFGGRFRGYAEGGIAWNRQLAWVAEREPELIVPLSRLRPAGGGAGLTVNVTVQGSLVHEREVSRFIGQAVEEQLRRGGTLGRRG